METTLFEKTFSNGDRVQVTAVEGWDACSLRLVVNGKTEKSDSFGAFGKEPRPGITHSIGRYGLTKSEADQIVNGRETATETLRERQRAEDREIAFAPGTSWALVTEVGESLITYTLCRVARISDTVFKTLTGRPHNKTLSVELTRIGDYDQLTSVPPARRISSPTARRISKAVPDGRTASGDCVKILSDDEYAAIVAERDAARTEYQTRIDAERGIRNAAREAETAEKFARARETGKPVVLKTHTEPCDGSALDCETDIIYTYALPDGKTSTQRAHAH